MILENIMKKLLCLILSLFMAFSAPATAFAIEYEIYDENGEVVDYVYTSDTAPTGVTAQKVSESWVKLCSPCH